MRSKSLLVLRVAIAFAFIYAGVSGILEPASWLGYFPTWLSIPNVSQETLLIAWSVVEILLGAWILFGRKIFIPSMIATVLLFGIAIVNLPQISILFRDFALGLAALSLALAHWKK